VLADYRSYVDCQDKVDELYRHPEEWAMKAMHNIANMGYFSSDRTIRSMPTISGISIRYGCSGYAVKTGPLAGVFYAYPGKLRASAGR
jgi:hypothetical protein